MSDHAVERGDSPYEHPAPLVGDDGNDVFITIQDGVVSQIERPREETNNRPKGAARREIVNCPDEAITLLTTTDLGTYYMMMKKTTVRNSGNHWLCLSCTDSMRYETPDHKGCVHIQRLKRYVADHPQQQAAA